jgi:hypothetical protein
MFILGFGSLLISVGLYPCAQEAYALVEKQETQKEMRNVQEDL